MDLHYVQICENRFILYLISGQIDITQIIYSKSILRSGVKYLNIYYILQLYILTTIVACRVAFGVIFWALCATISTSETPP